MIGNRKKLTTFASEFNTFLLLTAKKEEKMKEKMRLLVALSAICFSMSATAGRDKPINVEELPPTAQQVIKQHFANQKVVLVKADSELLDKEYNVRFLNGDRVEFDRNGEWEEVDCKNSQVPTALVPTEIARKIDELYPQAKVLQMSRDRKEYEVKLSNRVKLEFDTQFRLAKIKD